MPRRLLWFAFLVISITSGCRITSEQKAAQEEPLSIRLPMGYIPNVQYAPFYVALEKGYFRQAGLDVQLDYSFETDGVALVGANELPFSLASGEQVLLAREQGLPVVYVFAWWQDYPVAVASMKGDGILTPQDLKGRRIGLPGLFGASYVGLRALLDAGGLKEEDVMLDSVGFNQIEALVSGRDEAVVIYANNEPIQLESKGYPVDVIRVADYEALASNGLISNEKTIAEHPDLILKMNKAVEKGIAFTLEKPEEAYEICKKYVEGLDQADQQVQKAILYSSIAFWKTDHLGFSQPKSWKNMQEVLIDMGMISASVDPEKAYTNEFISSGND